MQLVARRNDFLLSTPIGSFDAYLERVAQIPVLSREREQELAQRLRDAGDLVAARELVLSHLRFVVHVARGYSGYGLPLGDIVQEGNIGLMKAVKRFDPALGVRSRNKEAELHHEASAVRQSPRHLGPRWAESRAPFQSK